MVLFLNGAVIVITFTDISFYSLQHSCIMWCDFCFILAQPKCISTFTGVSYLFLFLSKTAQLFYDKLNMIQKISSVYVQSKKFNMPQGITLLACNHLTL